MILHISIITLKLLLINTDKKESIKLLMSPFGRKKICTCERIIVRYSQLIADSRHPSPALLLVKPALSIAEHTLVLSLALQPTRSDVYIKRRYMLYLYGSPRWEFPPTKSVKTTTVYNGYSMSDLLCVLTFCILIFRFPSQSIMR